MAIRISFIILLAILYGGCQQSQSDLGASGESTEAHAQSGIASGNEAVETASVTIELGLTEKIVKIATERENFLNSFSVQANVTQELNQGKPQSGTFDLFVDGERIRCTAIWGKTVTDFAFSDGESILVKKSKGKRVSKIVGNDASGAPWTTPIHRFLTEVYNAKVSVYCKDIATEIREDGKFLIVESIREQDDDRLDFKVVVNFDPELNYAPTHVERFARYKNKDNWFRQSTCEMSEFEKYPESEIFVPGRAIFHMYSPPADEKSNALILINNKFRFSNWKIRAEIDADTFTIPSHDNYGTGDRDKN